MTNLSRVMVYSVSTDSFFNDKENTIANKLMELRVSKKELFNIRDNVKSKNKEAHDSIIKQIEEAVAITYKTKDDVIEDMLTDIKNSEDILSKELDDLLKVNKDTVRSLRRDTLFTNRNIKDKKGNVITKEINKSNRVVALFESSFTRTLNLSTEMVNESVVIVKAYHYSVLESLIQNDFEYCGNTYTFYSSSSGQMKNKKCVFVRKDLWDEHKGTFLCGLDKERINSTKFKKGDKTERGINTNKYLAYLSLQNSATTRWGDFDINKVVVCPDLEIEVTDKVEFIDRDDYELSIPEERTLPMNVSDGVGLILPHLSDKNFQFRIPWGKGLLSSFDFRKFAGLNGNYTITDVWGDTHHIINDDVQIILSASQLKTWKYYTSMKEYRQHFIENNCEAGKCNEEVVTNDIHLSYQYLQSLTGMEFDELDTIARMTNYDIHNIGSDKNVMLRSLGATKENDKKNYFQEALLMYDNLLNDSHAKEMIKSKKASMIEDALSGTLRVEGKRMFVLPDLYAYCNFLLNGNPEGLLGKNEVFTKDIREGDVNIMRSPALYLEHGIRLNKKNDELLEWFKTGAIYCSNKDMLARTLQMDFDGDTVNVCTNNQLLKVTKRHMRGVYPLYYEMSTAPLQELSNKNIYDSLELAFGSQIGPVSNSITKIWASGEFNGEKLNAIKFLTMYNNYMIDFSKTNFLPKPKGNAKKLIKKYTKGHMPYFFQFAKNKEKFADKVVVTTEKAVDENGNEFEKVISEHTPVVNMLEDIIIDRRITFRSVADKFDFTNLMSVNTFKSKGVELDNAIVQAYTKINKSKKWMIDKDSDDYKENKYVYVSKVIKEEILDAARIIDEHVTDIYVADVLVYHLHTVNKNGNKKTLWESFGEILVANLKYKLNGIKCCQQCGNEFDANSHKEKYCSDECAVEGEKERKKNRGKKVKNREVAIDITRNAKKIDK
jgi:hypothetical protein